MKKYFRWLALGLCMVGCGQFLDEKPSKLIDTPDSLEAIEALLDDSGTLNIYPTMTMVMGDEFLSNETGISGMELLERNIYLWMPAPFQQDDLVFDWRDCYAQIQNANVAMESLDKLGDRGSKWNELRGAALFYRAHAYFNLSTLFLEGPNLEDGGVRMKIPFRNTAKIVMTPELADRAAIRSLIISDLNEAESLLPRFTEYPTRPNRQASKALKARLYLDWEEYGLAKTEAEGALALGGELMDYKELTPSATYPFARFNKEVIWHARIGGTSYMSSQSAFQVSGELLGLYGSGDLRKSLFFVIRPNGFVNFRGSYQGGRPLFAGLALDELYLILAETLVRTGNTVEASRVLNELLVRRHLEDFSPPVLDGEEQALRVILEERRKELAFRGLRWADLRRINRDERFRTSRTRSFEGKEYILLPESEKYVLPIPARELSFY